MTNKEYNLSVKKDLEKGMGLPFNEIVENYDKTANAFLCVECREFVSAATVKFYADRIEEIKCYECQDKS